jgi:hypothetical protein
VFVFGELRGEGAVAQALVVAGSLLMIAGAIAISRAEASASEQRAWGEAMRREADRYGLDLQALEAAARGEAAHPGRAHRRRWWEAVLVLAALAAFAWLARSATRQPIPIDLRAMALLGAATLVLLGVATAALWRRTRFE